MVLSAKQKEAFWRDGFLPYPELLSRDELQMLQQRTEDIAYGRINFPETYRGSPTIQKEPRIERGEVQASNPLDELRKINSPALVDEVFMGIAKSPKILDVLEDLFGSPDIKLYGDQIFMKPPFHGSVKAYHQDSDSWPQIVPQNQITCWIALDAATLENGCMRCVPGSHTLGLIMREHLPQLLTDEFKAQDVAIELPAGGCMFHHSLNLHYTGENTTAYRRRGWAIHYMHAKSWDLSTPDKPRREYPQMRGKSYPGCVP